MMRRRSGWALLRAFVVAGLAAACAAGLAAFAGPAAAHSALESSDPAAGSSVPTSPRHVVLTFSEQPETRLSLVRLLDSSGEIVPGVSEPEEVPGAEPRLRVTPSQPLADGVYTVNWRVVSAVDGHVQSGAFVFGVGVAPQPGSEVVVDLLQPSPTARTFAAAGRWLLYGGLIALVGAAATSLLVFGGRLPAGGVPALRVAALAAVVAWCVLVWSQRVLVGVESLLPLFVSRDGKLLLALGVGLVFCIAAGAAVDIWPARWSLWLLGAAGAAAMLAHVLAGHAASPASVWWLNTTVQWVHLTAIGVWVGGLFWLLLGLRGTTPAERGEAIGAFTKVATATLAVVLVTGAARSVVQVGSLGALVDNTYGVMLLAKLGLVTGLLALGALNHFVWVPAVRRAEDGEPAPRGFRRNSTGELAVALVVLAVTAVLSGLAPPLTAATASPAAGAPQVTAAGEDYATTVRVQLSVSPGAAGENRYVAWVDDYDTGDPLATVTAVGLECSLPSEPSLGAVSIPLARQADGSWAGHGLEFAIAGLWHVTVVVEKDAGGVTVRLTVNVEEASAD